MSKSLIIGLMVASSVVFLATTLLVGSVLDDNPVWGTLLIIPVGCVVLFLILNKKLAKVREAERVEAIRAHRDEWGDEVCEILVQEKYKLDQRVQEIMVHFGEWGQNVCLLLVREGTRPGPRVHGIMSHVDEWGEDTCIALFGRRIGIGMSVDMVRASLGEPGTIDNRDTTKTGQKYRWVYGVPRQGAVYIWFKNDQVTRIKQ